MNVSLATQQDIEKHRGSYLESAVERKIKTKFGALLLKGSAGVNNSYFSEGTGMSHLKGGVVYSRNVGPVYMDVTGCYTKRLQGRKDIYNGMNIGVTFSRKITRD